MEKRHQSGCKTRRGDGGKIEWKSSEVNTRAVSREQNELIGKFKMAAGDVINIRGYTEIKRELVRFEMDCIWKG